MQWTSERPTEPGWYWVSYKYNNDEWDEPQLVELAIFGGQMCEVECTQDGGDYAPIDDFWLSEYRIFGPLVAPPFEDNGI